MKRRSYPERIRAALFLAIKRTAANLDACVKLPGKDFSRTRKLPLQAMLLMLIGMGSGSLSKELYDWFGYTSSTATASAFVQQRNKIRPEAVKMIFNEFVSSTTPTATFQGYRLFAVDGSDLRLPSDPTNDFSLIRNAEGQKQYNLAHLNAMFDLMSKVYVDATMQGKKGMNEHSALVSMIDRSNIPGKVIVLMDRGYESFNNIAHLQEKEWNFIIRAKESYGMISNLQLPNSEEFDADTTLTLTRRQTKETLALLSAYPERYRWIQPHTTFDYIAPKAPNMYDLHFRVVRFRISDGCYETIYTDLDPETFPVEKIKELYRLRWGIETSFRELKHIIGLSCLHGKKTDFLLQEVFARLIFYNYASLIARQVPAPQGKQINFSVAKLVQDGFKFENGSVTKTYGDEDFTLATTGEVEGSTVTYESSAPAVATVDGTGKVTIKGAGTAVITAKASATEEYAEAAATCTLTVGKKPIAIPTADATAFTYNGTEQTYALAEDGAYTITGNKQTNANETGYSVTVALKDTANTQWADGTTADKTYTFVIGKAVITVKAKDQSAYVGDKVPALSEDSYTVSGLVGEEKLTTQPTVKYVGADGKEITPDMTKTSEVKISASGAAASDNYTIRYEDGKLTVSTRPSGGGGGSRPSTHPVQTEVSKDPDGTVSLSKTSAAKGDKVTITVKPERHYEVDEVIVRDSKGKQLAVKDNGDGTFTFEMPADKVTVEPTFSWVNPFADVANSAYYVDAVEWMLKREVTQGTTETTFSPNLNCTRAQIVTFLWRAAGSPEPKGTVSFADVSAGSYYAKAVAWAVENGITGGTGDGLFSPDATCTRAQSAAFLYRAAGSPAVSGNAGFSDVAADAYYAQAVAWAKEHGITDGIGGGLFGSANDCTRAQIAAFLWRLYAEK